MNKILCVDDDKDILELLRSMLSGSGFQATTLSDPKEAAACAAKLQPDLILLDVMMPGLSGYEVCTLLRTKPGTADIPVIFLTALNQHSDKMKALSLGAVDFVSKPFKKDQLAPLIRHHLDQKKKWAARPVSRQPQGDTGSITQFRQALLNPGSLGEINLEAVSRMTHANVYKVLGQLKLSPAAAAKTIAEFLKLPFIAIINPDNIRLGLLPAKFSQGNNLVAVTDEEKGLLVILANPFDFELVDALKSMIQEPYSLAVADPDAISNLYHLAQQPGVAPGEKAGGLSVSDEALSRYTKQNPSVEQADDNPVKYITAKLIEAAIQERASDIHIEPKELFTAIRFRIDGDLREFTKLKRTTAVMAVTRLKVLAGMDITQKRRPQDGAFVAALGERKFTLRLATTSTNYGESLVIRLIEPQAKPKTLNDLGMDTAQAATMLQLSAKTQGMIIIAGPTGSGKTTTIFSFLSNMDCQRRSLISVEDPIEFRIPHANQQQVNEKAGVTFDALLKSSVRQDPDILFLGEVRDKASAQIALDFSSTGHLTVSTIHTSNAATAVFRLERLGVTRTQITDTVLAVISQRLIKRLCPKCKIMKPADQDCLQVFARFNRPAPQQTGHNAGCAYCKNTGYTGREAVYEIITMTPEVSEMIRSGASVGDIRQALRRGNVTLITEAALSKVTEGVVSFHDAYSKVLAEDLGAAPAAVQEDETLLTEPGQPAGGELPSRKELPVYIGGGKTARQDIGAGAAKRILVVDDDPDIRILAEKVIAGAGYNVTIAKDGFEAITRLHTQKFDLVLSDIDMPNLDGLRLLEILNQKNIKVDTVFFTARAADESEERGLALGALDYIR
ncbi:MAG: hypothetical protein A2285_06615, partial [Elusimicrobia bacterium RIFOXYA12_FULL_57_11]